MLSFGPCLLCGYYSTLWLCKRVTDNMQINVQELVPKCIHKNKRGVRFSLVGCCLLTPNGDSKPLEIGDLSFLCLSIWVSGLSRMLWIFDRSRNIFKYTEVKEQINMEYHMETLNFPDNTSNISVELIFCAIWSTPKQQSVCWNSNFPGLTNEMKTTFLLGFIYTFKLI